MEATAPDSNSLFSCGPCVSLHGDATLLLSLVTPPTPRSHIGRSVIRNVGLKDREGVGLQVDHMGMGEYGFLHLV